MRIILPALVLAAIATPLAASPQPIEEVVTVRINIAGIDVSTSEGLAKLEARIDEKVRAACTITPSSRYGYGRPVRDETCMTKARAEALAQAERLVASSKRANRQVAAN